MYPPPQLQHDADDAYFTPTIERGERGYRVRGGWRGEVERARESAVEERRRHSRRY